MKSCSSLNVLMLAATYQPESMDLILEYLQRFFGKNYKKKVMTQHSQELKTLMRSVSFLKNPESFKLILSVMSPEKLYQESSGDDSKFLIANVVKTLLSRAGTPLANPEAKILKSSNAEVQCQAVELLLNATSFKNISFREYDFLVKHKQILLELIVSCYSEGRGNKDRLKRLLTRPPQGNFSCVFHKILWEQRGFFSCSRQAGNLAKLDKFLGCPDSLAFE